MSGMSGAEIVSIIEEAAIEEFPYDGKDDGTEIVVHVALEKIRELVTSAWAKKRDSDGNNKEINSLIDNDLIDLELKYLGNFDSGKKNNARELLEKKYSWRDDIKNYESKGYKSASKYGYDK